MTRGERERAVVHYLCAELARAGWVPMEVDNGEERVTATSPAAVEEHVFSVDDSWAVFRKGPRSHMVRLISGNDRDVIADYSLPSNDAARAELVTVHEAVDGFAERLPGEGDA